MIDIKHASHEEGTRGSAKCAGRKEISEELSIRCEVEIPADQVRQHVSVGAERCSQQHGGDGKCCARPRDPYRSYTQTGKRQHYSRNTRSRKAIEASTNH